HGNVDVTWRVVGTAGLRIRARGEQEIAHKRTAIHAMRLCLVAPAARAPPRLGMQAPAYMRHAEGRGIVVRFEMLAQIFCVKSALDAGDGSLVDINDDL